MPNDIAIRVESLSKRSPSSRLRASRIGLKEEKRPDTFRARFQPARSKSLHSHSVQA